MTKDSITGLILAGGKARRMGGIDKGLIAFKGKPMVTHAIERLSPQVSEILINANREIEHYQTLGFAVVTDEIIDFAGPLAGLHAGMKTAKTEFILSVPCDSPLLPDDLSQRLMEVLEARKADIAVAKTGEQHHPVFCLCRTNLAQDLENFLNAGGRKVDEWQKQHAYVEVIFDDNPLAFSNVNTPEELNKLEGES
ncbi:MAG: molybdenum cofactor guanylyltransferase MobA [Methylocystaceae bacterium]|nr:molybdenum cofactor guanylyltransferase MobA [Methylocystaceae bacterium]